MPRRLLGWLVAAAAVAGILLWLLCRDPDGNGSALAYLLTHLASLLDDAQALRARILGFGNAAPLVVVLLQILQVLVAPVPGEATGLIAGYLFGVTGGFVYSTIGLTIGSVIAFVAGRYFAGFLPRRLLASPAYRRFVRLVHKNDFVLPFIAFLLPGFPKDILSYVLGASRMPLPAFVVITGVGRMPGTLLLTLNGAKVFERDFVGLALLLGVSLVVFLPCYYWRHQLLGRWDGKGAEEETVPENPPT